MLETILAFTNDIQWIENFSVFSKKQCIVRDIIIPLGSTPTFIMTSSFSRLYESIWMVSFICGSLTFSFHGSYYACQSDCAVVCVSSYLHLFVIIKNAYTIHNKVRQASPPPPRPFLFLFKGWGELVATLSRSEPVEAQRSWLNWSFIGLQCKMIMTKACVPSCLLLSVVQSRNCSHLALTAKFLNWHPNYSLATWRPVHLHISGK